MTFTFTKSLLCLLLLSTAVFAQKSAHDLLLDDLDEVTQAFEPIIEDYDEERPSTETRLLKTYPNMRIHIDYEHLTEGTDEWKEYAQKQLIPAVVDYLQAALKVKYPITSPITSTAKTLCGFATPVAIQKGVEDADMVVFINSRNSKGASWMAATTLCTVSSGIKRPIIVNIGINVANILVADPDVNPTRHDLNINVMMHEFIHALAMNGPLFKYFVDDDGNLLTEHRKTATINGETRNVLDLPYLTDRLRAFYGCDSVPGLVMENGGAHFSRRFFQWDIMATAAITGTKISEFTLAVLEGTGWFVPDYCYAEPYTFGKGEGCGFWSEDIDSINYPDEYCQGNKLGCTEIGHSGGYCVGDSLIKVGRVHTHQFEFNCDNPKGIYYSTFASKQVYGRGLGSKCFSGNLTTSSKEVNPMTYCLTFTCQGSGLSTVLVANWGKDTITCNQEGPIAVNGYKGGFNCPDPVKFCSTIGAPTCLRNCMGRGECFNGKCVCDAGYTGIDCGFAG